MVNVAQYQIVATSSTVSECEQKYVQLLGSKGITTPEERPRPRPAASSPSSAPPCWTATPTTSSAWRARRCSTRLRLPE